jgi:glucokinase
VPTRNAAAIAGTGLEGAAHRVGRFIVARGHTDFAPRHEDGFARHLTARFGRAATARDLERTPTSPFPPRRCAACDVGRPGPAPSRISAAALERRCPDCVRALGIFVSVYGAEAGNLALRSVATAGVIVGGGIAPKILPALPNGRFVEAFGAKAPMEGFLSRVPVSVILNDRAGLLGAAVHAGLQT